jgi:hypothetical protein
MNEIGPDEALAVLTQYLRTLALQKHPLDEYGDPQPLDGSYASEESPAPDVARGWCRTLLTAANADGWGACKLCRS